MASLPDGFEKRAENERFVLLLEETWYNFAVIDKYTARLWLANPLNPEYDLVAIGNFTQNRRSQMFIEFVLEDAPNPSFANSYRSCIPEAVRDEDTRREREVRDAAERAAAAAESGEADDDELDDLSDSYDSGEIPDDMDADDNGEPDEDDENGYENDSESENDYDYDYEDSDEDSGEYENENGYDDSEEDDNGETPEDGAAAPSGGGGTAGSGRVTVSSIPNGFRADYFFQLPRITVPMTIVLTEDGFQANILFDEVTVDEDSLAKLTDVSVLPFFGCASGDDEGFMLVPDGAGALINFNNGKINIRDVNNNNTSYTKRVYNTDLSLRSELVTSHTEDISLPIFGVVKNGGGFLAEVTSGASLSTLSVLVAGFRTSYDQIYMTGSYHGWTKIMRYGQTDAEVDNVLFMAFDSVSIPVYSVNYRFVADTPDRPAGYMDLANIYRDQLIGRGLKKHDNLESTLYAQFYGGVPRRKFVFGFAYDGKEWLTTFDQTQAILQDLNENLPGGLAAFLKWHSSGSYNYRHTITVEPMNFLGGGRGLAELSDWASGEGIPVFPAINTQGFYRNGNGWSRSRHGAQTVNFAPVRTYPIHMIWSIDNIWHAPYHLIKPSLLDRVFEQLTSSLERQNIGGVMFEAPVSDVYSDFGKDGWQRDRQVLALEEHFSDMYEDFSLVFENPRDFMLTSADYLKNLSLNSSRNHVFDVEVPFLPILLKGYVSFAGKPVNYTDASQRYFLKHIETGANLQYAITERPNEILFLTNIRDIYAMEYANNREIIIDRSLVLHEISEKVGDSTIIDHERDGFLAVVTYSNGVRIYVNHGITDIVRDGRIIPAEDFVITEGAR
jgi:hypothetical protein